jgi:hypothetical protein
MKTELCMVFEAPLCACPQFNLNFNPNSVVGMEWVGEGKDAGINS